MAHAMSLSELEQNVYENLGDLDDIDWRTYESASELKLRAWINRAYQHILMWKYPTGEHIRFPILESVFFLQTVVKTGSVLSATTTTASLDSGVNANNGQYTDWLIEITSGTGSGQRAFVIAFNGSTRTVTIEQPWSVAPDSTSVYSMYKRFYSFVPATDPTASENIPIDPTITIRAISKVSDLIMPWDLKPSSRDENFTLFMKTPSIPMSYFRRANTLFFDMPVNTVRTYRIEAMTMPNDMVLTTDYPFLPSQFHECIVLYATLIGLRRQQEWQGYYATEKALEDQMGRLKQDVELGYEREDAHVEVL
jgi:hypothetical protein